MGGWEGGREGVDEVAEGKRFDTDFGQLAPMAQFASVPRCARFVARASLQSSGCLHAVDPFERGIHSLSL